MGTNWTGTFSISNDKYLSTAADLKLEGQYQEWRATRPADVSKWSDEDLNTMVGFVQHNDLRKLAQLGFFGPPGATWVSLSDGDYKTVVNDAAVNIASSVVPVGSVGRAVEHTAEAVSDVSSEVRNADRVADANILDKIGDKKITGTVNVEISIVKVNTGSAIKGSHEMIYLTILARERQIQGMSLIMVTRSRLIVLAR